MQAIIKTVLILNLIALPFTLLRVCKKDVDCARIPLNECMDYAGCSIAKRAGGELWCRYYYYYFDNCCKIKEDGTACAKVDENGEPFCVFMRSDNLCKSDELAFLD
jgi:hypothetical protein